jgi:DUF1680 family protein
MKTMDGLSRRGFLRGAAVTSGAALLAPAMVAEMKAEAMALPKVVVQDKVAPVVRPFALQEVRLLPGPWKDMMELNRSWLYSLPNDRLAYNFRVTAGIPTDADPLGGWEAPDCELRGHYVGHYLSACALLYATSDDVPLRNKANELVAMLAECQAKDGYIGAYPVVFYDRLKKDGKVWAPFYTYHKILAGMLDMYQHAGNAQALVVAKRMADWADGWTKSMSAEELQTVLLVEQGGMSESAWNLYALTGDGRYRELAVRFEHRKFLDPLEAGEDKLAGNHANTNIPKVIGTARAYELTGDERYRKISDTFYHAVVDHHTYCTGGTSDGEVWHAPDAVSHGLGASAEECCCSYNMMKLSRLMFMREPKAAYFDYYERLMVNVRRGTQDRNGMLMYYVPLKPGMYKQFGTQFDAFWCCTGTGSEEYAKLTDSVYFQSEDALWVNLFVASRLNWKERGLKLKQTTGFPSDGRVKLTVESAPNRSTAMKVRVPYWVGSGFVAKVNGEAVAAPLDATGYAVLVKDWKAGDIVELELPMSLHVSPATDDPKVQAAMYGPMVLAVLMGTDGLTTSMIYKGFTPDRNDGMPMPEVKQAGVWLETAEATTEYPLRFRSKGEGISHTLVPLSAVMDERYSVYVRNTA